MRVDWAALQTLPKPRRVGMPVSVLYHLGLFVVSTAESLIEIVSLGRYTWELRAWYLFEFTAD